MEKNHANKFIICCGVILFLVGILFISSNYLNEKVEKSYSNMNLKLMAYNDSIQEEIEEEQKEVVQEVQQEKKEEKKEVKKVSYNYVAKLSIPKISLERGLVEKNSRYNSIDYNIETLKISDYPDVPKGNLILLSHSGTSYISFFKHLYKLSVGDECYIEYQGKTYKYVIDKIYNKPKIGKVTIDRNYEKNTLTLITCTKNSQTEQTIYIAYLVK